MLDYIEERLHDAMTLDEIAAYASVSQPQMYRLFQAATGHPVKEYIRKRKISEAARMLAGTEHSLTHIAQAGGFDSFQTFAKLFKKCTGRTPSQYRAAADIYFSFEPIRLTSEDETATVKIATMPPMRVLTRRYYAAEQEPLEPEAFQSAYREAIRLGWSCTQTRFFGYNCDLPFPEDHSDSQQAYRMMLVPPQGQSDDREIGNTWEWDTFPGGMYAVTSTPFGNPDVIVRNWNRLLSDWLPSSKFSRAEGPFVEEFITYRGKAARLHLYLPVRRKLEQPFIRIVLVGIRQVAYTRAYGLDAQQRAEEALMDWIRQSECLQGHLECRYYMAYASAPAPSCLDWWEAGLEWNGEIAADGRLAAKSLGGGEYACLTTEVYGTMSGVVEQIHAWLKRQQVYERDDKRQWFAQYAARGDQAIERMQVTCYVPVRRREN